MWISEGLIWNKFSCFELELDFFEIEFDQYEIEQDQFEIMFD